MRRIVEQIPTSERGEAVWHTSSLAAYLTRIGLMQSRITGRFSPRSSLATPAPATTAEDTWPFLRA
jgi:hypothetical protein